MMAETDAGGLDPKARIDRRIREDEASALWRWEILSRRIEAVKHDLALTLDGQSRVVLQTQLADLEREREALEAELERLGIAWFEERDSPPLEKRYS